MPLFSFSFLFLLLSSFFLCFLFGDFITFKIWRNPRNQLLKNKDEIKNLISNVRNKKIDGLNVTVPYKKEIINESDQEDDFQLYYQEDDFVDLCIGPHLPSLSFIGSFKLTKVSGAYWKGDEKNKQLTRIYGISFPKQKLLNDYNTLIEEANKTLDYETHRNALLKLQAKIYEP